MMSLLWMLVLVLANPALACSGGGDEKYRVIRKTDEGGKQLVVATEETARLFCQTNVPWKKCWWKPPRNGVREVSTYSNLKLSGFFLNFSHLQSKYIRKNLDTTRSLQSLLIIKLQKRLLKCCTKVVPMYHKFNLDGKLTKFQPE